MLQSSIVLVGEIGGNDYNYAFFTNKNVSDVAKLIPDVVQTIIDAAKVLYIRYLHTRKANKLTFTNWTNKKNTELT